MTQEQQADDLIRCLLAERKEYQDIGVPSELPDKRRLLRSLMNVRPPAPVSEEFLHTQDAYLQERLAQRGVTRSQDLTPVRPGLYLWQGDITTLAVDAMETKAGIAGTGDLGSTCIAKMLLIHSRSNIDFTKRWQAAVCWQRTASREKNDIL